jgi:hypothetical protein
MRAPAEILREHNIDYIETRRGTYTTTCPNCNGGYLNVKIDRKGTCWFCHDCKWSGPQPGEKEDKVGSDLGPIKDTFDYTNETGERLFQVLKFEPLNAPKQFRQRTGPDQEKWSIKGVRIVPYRLPELSEDIADEKTIFVVEGEKDVNTLRDHGVAATCNPMGAGKWWPDFNSILRGANVVICGDNDQPGRDHVALVAKNLHGAECRLRVLDLAAVWPEIEEGDDISDWFKAGGTVERLWEIVEQIPEWTPKGGNGEAPPWEGPGGDDTARGQTQRGIPLTFFGDLSENPLPKPWLIKNVMARDETSSWFAPPGKGKSALLTDIAVHSAGGIDWRGYRTKGRAGVVYFALERADLVRRRLIAHKRRDDLRDLPIAVAGGVIDLLNRNCVDTILATIWEAEQRFACEVGLAIFDTYSKGIAAGGGDEDKAKDQNVVQANLRRLFDRGRHIHIAGIGHTGKDETKGERGSNARKADVDVQVQITGDAIKTATVVKANDQAEGVLTGFRLEPFDFGMDEDDEPVRTFILSPEILVGDRTQRARGPSDRQVLALRALAKVVLSEGRDPPAAYRLPAGIKVVGAEAWKEELFHCNALDRSSGNPWARFKELRDALAARNLIGCRDDLVWPVRSV